MSFNPLTGISSILTYVTPEGGVALNWQFQSPDGDFVYSDTLEIPRMGENRRSFNPLTGISSILTRHRGKGGGRW